MWKTLHFLTKNAEFSMESSLQVGNAERVVSVFISAIEQFFSIRTGTHKLKPTNPRVINALTLLTIRQSQHRPVNGRRVVT